MSEQQADVPAVPGVTREPLVMPQDEFEMVKKGAKILGSITARLYRTMAAARIEMLQNGPHAGMQWILNSLPDVFDGTEWDGLESAEAWFDRAEAADRAAEASAVPPPSPVSAEAVAADTGPDEALPAEPHMDLLESAWGVIANAGWDDCAKTTGWQEAAVRWRDDYHRWLDLHLRPGGYQTWEELAADLVRERDALVAEVAELRRALRDAADAEPLAEKEARDG